ncbi:MAG: glycerol-3-phosphate 1-O-acyltransferase PlsY, partial [Firmicutes bacterium]|nr:glycerol-3-phosphate 1-O-acyltransferase PlsY [Bacillota bacterium]
MRTLLVFSALILIVCYLLGSIPFGYLVGLMRGVDVRKQGSGNIGATNVLRLLGPLAGGTVFLADALKGIVAVFLGQVFLPFDATWAGALCGLAAILGHNYSLYLRFKGGKGVATSLATLLALSPSVALLALLIFVITVALTKYVSLGSIVGAGSAWLITLGTREPAAYKIYVTVAALLIIYLCPEA